MTITKREACELLHISERTLRRRMADGSITFTRKGNGRFGEVEFTYEGLGLAAREPEPLPEPQPAPKPEPKAQDLEPLTQEQADRLFAAAYLEGRVTDSFGNTINQTKHSALGPREAQIRKRDDGTVHMDQRLLSGGHVTLGVDGEPITDAGADNHPLIARRIDLRKSARTSQNETRTQIANRIVGDILKGYSR